MRANTNRIRCAFASAELKLPLFKVDFSLFFFKTKNGQFETILTLYRRV